MSRPTVSVVVLNWLDPHLAERSLRSAARALHGLETEYIVVENGSKAEVDPGIIPGRRLRKIWFEKNVGVSKGRNAGINAARGSYLLILDDDAVVVDGLVELLEFMEYHRTIGLAGPRIVDSAGKLMFTCRRFPTVVDKVARRLPGSLGESVLNGSELRDWSHSFPALVDYVIGACQVIRHEAVQQVGGYDEASFYGPEDVDLCLRMWEGGWCVAYYPPAVVIHDERRMTRRPSVMAVRHVASLVHYFIKHRYGVSRSRLYRRLPRPHHAPTRGTVDGIDVRF